jgi:hypothetical protein
MRWHAHNASRSVATRPYGYPKTAAATCSSTPRRCLPARRPSSSPPESPTSMPEMPRRWRAQRGLSEQSGNRFLLGFGVSHRPLVSDMPSRWRPCAATWRRCVRPLSVATTLGEAPDRARGTGAENASAGGRNGRWSAYLLHDTRAHRRGAPHPRHIQLENYANNWRRLGFADEDLAGGGPNRFVDANVAWGDEGAIRRRSRLFWDAGADHVAIQSIRPHGSQGIIDERIFDLLAPSTRSPNRPVLPRVRFTQGEGGRMRCEIPRVPRQKCWQHVQLQPGRSCRSGA